MSATTKTGKVESTEATTASSSPAPTFTDNPPNTANYNHNKGSSNSNSSSSTNMTHTAAATVIIPASSAGLGKPPISSRSSSSTSVVVTTAATASSIGAALLSSGAIPVAVIPNSEGNALPTPTPPSYLFSQPAAPLAAPPTTSPKNKNNNINNTLTFNASTGSKNATVQHSPVTTNTTPTTTTATTGGIAPAAMPSAGSTPPLHRSVSSRSLIHQHPPTATATATATAGGGGGGSDSNKMTPNSHHHHHHSHHHPHPSASATTVPTSTPSGAGTAAATTMTSSHHSAAIGGYSNAASHQREQLEVITPPSNFSMVCPGVYRSSFPSRKNFTFLKSLQLRSICFLCPEDYPETNLKFCEENAIQLLRFPMEGNKEPLQEIPVPIMHAIVSALIDTRNHPALIHCNAGKHRTGCVCGCLRRVQGWAMTSIFQEYLHFTGDKARLADQLFIELYRPTVRVFPPYIAPWFEPTSKVSIAIDPQFYQQQKQQQEEERQQSDQNGGGVPPTEGLTALDETVSA